MNRMVVVPAAIVAIGFLSGAVSASRHIPSDTRSYTYVNGDGVGGETVTRNGDAISGDMWVGAKHAHYEGRVAADGTTPRLDIRAWRSAAEAKHPRVLAVIVGRDTTTLIEHLGTHVDTQRFASQSGMVPVINPSVGLTEIVVARARSQKSRPARIPILFIDALYLDAPGKDRVGAVPMALDVTFLAGDTVRIGNGTSTDQMRLIVDADGRSRGGASGTTAKDKFAFRPTSKPVSPRE